MNLVSTPERATTDLRLAFRSLFRSRGVYVPAIAILALGIGMSVSMFSLVDAVLLRPLPFPGQRSIQLIWKTNPATAPQVEELAYPELRDLQENIAAFESVALLPTSLYGYGRVLQKGRHEPVEIESTPVSHDFFHVLGVTPVIGRDFRESDERVGAAPVVILSDRVWREQFAADRNIIGQMIRLNGQGHTVIGVMAPGVEFPRGAGLWIPLGVDARVVERRGTTFLQAIARVKPGQTHQTVESQLNVLFRRLAVDYPQFYPASQRAVVTPLVEYWTGSARSHLWIMLAASLLLLLAAMASSGSLLLSRTLARQTELATRLALGAGRGQILSQLTAEALLVAVLAVLAGLVAADWAIRLLVRWGAADIPRLSDAGLDLTSFCFAAGAGVAAACVCSLIPAWFATRAHLETALREGGMRLSVSRKRGRAQNLFLAAQAALTTILLAAAVLLVVSYRAAISADVGFAHRDAVSMNLPLRGPGLLAGQAFDSKSRRQFYARLLDRIREAAGVTSAAAVLLRPLEGTIGWDVSYEFAFEASNPRRPVLPKADYEVVTPAYFETVGTPLLEGRDFTEHDTEDTEPVVIISRSLAERFRAIGLDPVGQRVRLGIGSAPWNKIVGVCADARYRGVTQTGPSIFVPYRQAGAPTNYVVIRGTRSAEELTATVRRALAEIDASQAISGVATIGELIGRDAARQRFNMVVLLWFAICSAALAAFGVHSVVTEVMIARDREVAIRIALGARRSRLVRDMVSRPLAFIIAGEAAGGCALAALSPLASNVLYSVTARNPLVLVLTAAFLFAISLLAAFRPPWTAASQPGGALRAP